jgi:hypothetical protein
MSPYVTWRVHSAHGGKLKLVWVFTDRGNLEAESRTKWTVTNPGSSRAWSKAQNQDSFIELQPGQPISAYVSLLPSIQIRHIALQHLWFCLLPQAIYMLYINVHKKAPPTSNKLLVCADVSAFVHGFMPWAWLHFWRWNRVIQVSSIA